MVLIQVELGKETHIKVKMYAARKSTTISNAVKLLVESNDEIKKTIL
jgi:hypothetical protein